jgi:hypothetical protein
MNLLPVRCRGTGPGPRTSIPRCKLARDIGVVVKPIECQASTEIHVLMDGGKRPQRRGEGRYKCAS